MGTRFIGHDTPRLEGPAKVSGRTAYIHNLRLPGMLHLKVVRSPIPHGRVLSIDSSAATAVPGVVRVITSADVTAMGMKLYYGPAFHDQPILADGKVRYVGDLVAAVIAETPEIAAQAVDLVQVEYEELPAVFDALEAAKPESPKVHDVINPATTYADLKHLAGRKDTNIVMDYHLRVGDVDAALTQADHFFDDTFYLGATTHLPMEPHVTVGELDEGGRMVLHSATQSPSFVRLEVARLLGWPESRVRVKSGHLGGGYGAKLYMKLEALTAAAVLAVQQPVRFALSMDEEFVTVTRHACTVRLRTGVRKDGKILGRHCELYWNSGSYADIGPRVTQKSGFTSAGPYQIENVAIDSYNVYTNLPPAGALRGFGIPQPVWAYESQMDIIAHKLGVDPMQYRLQHVLRSGDMHHTGTSLNPTATYELLAELDRRMREQPPDTTPLPPNVKRGRGAAIGIKALVTPTSSVSSVIMHGDGSVVLNCSTVDMGQASDTVMALIVAETLGITPQSITVMRPDTDVTPYDMGTLGSRSTFCDGNAVRLAAEDMRSQLLAQAAKDLEVAEVDLDLKDGAVCARGSDHKVSFGDIMKHTFGMQAGTLIGHGAYTTDYIKPDPATGKSPKITDFWFPGVVGVEVLVDTDTGKVRVTKMITLGDVGTPLNPSIAGQQIVGASLMALGMTMSENIQFENGQVVNGSLATYKIPAFTDIPDHIETGFCGGPHHRGPFGAKGAGETGSFAVSPAIANAIYDAVGVRMKELPLTPERVWQALQQKQEGVGSR